MAVMTGLSRDSASWTIDDLEQLPDDGQRYELLDGVLLVSPAPVVKHQAAVHSVARALDSVCPPEFVVLIAPVDWQPDRRTSFQPDVLVTPNRDLGVKNLTEPLTLAVEVLSPSTRSQDLLGKRLKYESAGVASYWVVDPEAPSVLAWDLIDGHYQVVGEAQGDQQLSLLQPFPITLSIGSLLARYNW
jgi:Uma2 family endonuclease